MTTLVALLVAAAFAALAVLPNRRVFARASFDAAEPPALVLGTQRHPVEWASGKLEGHSEKRESERRTISVLTRDVSTGAENVSPQDVYTNYQTESFTLVAPTASHPLSVRGTHMMSLFDSREGHWITAVWARVGDGSHYLYFYDWDTKSEVGYEKLRLTGITRPKGRWWTLVPAILSGWVLFDAFGWSVLLGMALGAAAWFAVLSGRGYFALADRGPLAAFAAKAGAPAA
jgi:hypothetical protein